jgi:hypothetical protein
MALDLSPPPLAQLCCTQVVAHVEKYLRVVRVLALRILVVPFDETTLAFRLFHSLQKVDLPTFVNDFHLDKGYFRLGCIFFALACSSCLSFDKPLSMVCMSFLQYFFVPYDFVSVFDLFFEVCGHIVHIQVPHMYHICL